MIADLDVGVAAVIAALVTGLLTLAGAVVAAFYSRRASRHSATNNGRMQGEIIESIAEKQDTMGDNVSLILLWIKEHTRTHENEYIA